MTIDPEPDQVAWEWFADAHPHEAYETWPERFWQYFTNKRPGVSRERMEQLLAETNKALSVLERTEEQPATPGETKGEGGGE